MTVVAGKKRERVWTQHCSPPETHTLLVTPIGFYYYLTNTKILAIVGLHIMNQIALCLLVWENEALVKRSYYCALLLDQRLDLLSSFVDMFLNCMTNSVVNGVCHASNFKDTKKSH